MQFRIGQVFHLSEVPPLAGGDPKDRFVVLIGPPGA